MPVTLFQSSLLISSGMKTKRLVAERSFAKTKMTEAFQAPVLVLLTVMAEFLSTIVPLVATLYAVFRAWMPT